MMANNKNRGTKETKKSKSPNKLIFRGKRKTKGISNCRPPRKIKCTNKKCSNTTIEGKWGENFCFFCHLENEEQKLIETTCKKESCGNIKYQKDLCRECFEKERRKTAPIEKTKVNRSLSKRKSIKEFGF